MACWAFITLQMCTLQTSRFTKDKRERARERGVGVEKDLEKSERESINEGKREVREKDTVRERE